VVGPQPPDLPFDEEVAPRPVGHEAATTRILARPAQPSGGTNPDRSLPFAYQLNCKLGQYHGPRSLALPTEMMVSLRGP